MKIRILRRHQRHFNVGPIGLPLRSPEYYEALAFTVWEAVSSSLWNTLRAGEQPLFANNTRQADNG